MIYAFIKNETCINIATFENEEAVNTFKEVVVPSEYDDIIECLEGFGIGDIYKAGTWTKLQVQPTLEEEVSQLKQQLEITQAVLDELLFGGTI